MVYNPPTILIVDDDEAICELVSEGLIEDGYTCDIASTADEALTKLQNHRFEIALLDIKLPGKSGMELLRTFQTLSQNTGIVMMTAVKDLDTAIQAMKLGASDYIVKPFTIDKLSASIGTVLESTKRYSSVSGTANQSLNAINAIAYGVDAQVDYFDFHSKIVTEKTIDCARRLCLPAKEIEKWAVARNELYSERNRYIKSTLSKLERNPIAQVMLGLARPVCEFPKLGGEQN
jgi:DNA-binding response OmpR family regulator